MNRQELLEKLEILQANVDYILDKFIETTNKVEQRFISLNNEIEYYQDEIRLNNLVHFCNTGKFQD